MWAPQAEVSLVQSYNSQKSLSKCSEKDRVVQPSFCVSGFGELRLSAWGNKKGHRLVTFHSTSSACESRFPISRI